MTIGRPRTVSDEQVLAGAARVIARVGPARLTLAEVGREVGLSAATVLQRFGSKRGVLLAVARHGADALPLQVAAAQDASAPTAALIDVLAGIAGGIRSSEEFANHLAFLLLELADPQFQQISSDYTVAVERAIADVLAAGQAAGELISDDLGRLPRAIHAAYNGALLTWGLAGDGSPAEQVRDQLTLLLGPYLQPTRPAQPGPSS
ncbi:TetR/AcrR family transcriptional regulator [Nonomuraea sp. NPDC049400]|uniref:TetR/AcrR family transcriptional regulator n=1 Tax=Nonomuraea sp. NPDC049400 TaxID=3364352 RepID=UPI0037877F52